MQVRIHEVLIPNVDLVREPQCFHHTPGLNSPSPMHFDSNRPLDPKLLDGDYAELAAATTKVVEDISSGRLRQPENLANVSVALVVLRAQAIHWNPNFSPSPI